MQYLCYLFPILVNMMNGGMSFITAYRFSEAGASKLMVTGTMMAWAICYCLTSMIAGRIVSQRRAARMIMGGCAFLFICSVGAILLPSLNLQYLWLCALGIGGGLYATAFQLFIKGMEKGADGGTVRSVSLYTFAWSMGIAFGPFVFGIIPWKTAYVANAVCAVLIAAGIYLIDRYCVGQGSSDAADNVRQEEPSQPRQEPMFAGLPDLVHVGWISGICVSMYVSIVRTLTPDLAVQFQIGKFHGGMVLALTSLCQALIGLAFCMSRKWMYRALPLALIAVSGTAGIVLLTAGGYSLGAMYLAAILCAAYTAPGYFMFTFHALVHPTKSGFYVSVNETLVGITGILAPFLGGLLAERFSTASAFYVMGAILMVMTVLELIVRRAIFKKAART